MKIKTNRMNSPKTSSFKFFEEDCCFYESDSDNGGEKLAFDTPFNRKEGDILEDKSNLYHRDEIQRVTRRLFTGQRSKRKLLASCKTPDKNLRASLFDTLAGPFFKKGCYENLNPDDCFKVPEAPRLLTHFDQICNSQEVPEPPQLSQHFNQLFNSQLERETEEYVSASKKFVLEEKTEFISNHTPVSKVNLMAAPRNEEIELVVTKAQLTDEIKQEVISPAPFYWKG